MNELSDVQARLEKASETGTNTSPILESKGFQKTSISFIDYAKVFVLYVSQQAVENS